MAVRGLQQCQDPCQQFGIGVALESLIGLEVDSNHKNGSSCGLSEKSLVSTAFNGIVFHLRDAVCCVMEDQDSSMCAFIGGIAMGRVSKGMSSSRFEVLTHGVVPLAVEMCFHEDIELIVPAPKPIQCVFAKSCDIGHMDAHVLV